MEFKNPATDAEKAYDEITSRIKVDLEKVTEELMGSSIYHLEDRSLEEVQLARAISTALNQFMTYVSSTIKIADSIAAERQENKEEN